MKTFAKYLKLDTHTFDFHVIPTKVNILIQFYAVDVSLETVLTRLQDLPYTVVYQTLGHHMEGTEREHTHIHICATQTNEIDTNDQSKIQRKVKRLLGGKGVCVRVRVNEDTKYHMPYPLKEYTTHDQIPVTHCIGYTDDQLEVMRIFSNQIYRAGLVKVAYEEKSHSTKVVRHDQNTKFIADAFDIKAYLSAGNTLLDFKNKIYPMLYKKMLKDDPTAYTVFRNLDIMTKNIVIQLAQEASVPNGLINEFILGRQGVRSNSNINNLMQQYNALQQTLP